MAKDIIKDKDKQIYKTTLGSDNDEVIIGDDKSAFFKPQIKFTKWNKENSLTLKVPDTLIPNATQSLVNGKLEYKNSKIGFYFNPDPDNSDNFKFGLILYEKPTTNIWSFQLEGWEEFDFFYQPPLKNVNADGSTWEYSGDGIDNRPAAVTGSYATYHKTKKNYEIGGTNYKTGKFGHYYRPKFIDSNGVTVWANLDIKDGTVTITIPQEFLDKATYPVKANDTFGYITAGASYINSSYIRTSIFTLSVTANITGLSYYISEGSASQDTAAAIYDDDATGSEAGTLMGSSDVMAGTTGPGWRNATITLNNLLAGNWWLAHWQVSARDCYYDAIGNGASFAGTFSTWPNPAGTPDKNDTKQYSIYATYTAGGGAYTGWVYVTED